MYTFFLVLQNYTGMSVFFPMTPVHYSIFNTHFNQRPCPKFNCKARKCLVFFIDPTWPCMSQLVPSTVTFDLCSTLFQPLICAETFFNCQFRPFLSRAYIPRQICFDKTLNMLRVIAVGCATCCWNSSHQFSHQQDIRFDLQSLTTLLEDAGGCIKNLHIYLGRQSDRRPNQNLG